MSCRASLSPALAMEILPPFSNPSTLTRTIISLSTILKSLQSPSRPSLKISPIDLHFSLKKIPTTTVQSTLGSMNLKGQNWWRGRDPLLGRSLFKKRRRELLKILILWTQKNRRGDMCLEWQGKKPLRHSNTRRTATWSQCACNFCFMQWQP